MLPDRSLLIRHKMLKNAKIRKFKWDILGDFQTMWRSENGRLSKLALLSYFSYLVDFCKNWNCQFWGVNNAELVFLFFLKFIQTNTSARVENKVSLHLIEQQHLIVLFIGKDSCSGDSGGPLMSQKRGNLDQTKYLVGIVSFGTRSCGKVWIVSIKSKRLKLSETFWVIEWDI